VEQFANELGVLPTVLLEQFQAAHIRKHSILDSVTEEDKTQFLEYLRKIYGARGEKIKVTVRKKRTGRGTPFSGIITTQAAALRLEEALIIGTVKDGLCAGCSQIAPRKMANTNHGTLALCPECLRRALRRYRKFITSQRLSVKKKKGPRKSFVRILQGGAPGLGKRSS
jgi:hypothetical protein